MLPYLPSPSVSIPSFSSFFPSFCVLSIYPQPPSQSTHLCHSLSLLCTPPQLRSMVGCVSCVWTRPRKPSARPWGSSCSRRWSYSMPTRARSRCRPRRSTSVSCRSSSRRCRCAGLTWNKRLWMKHSSRFKRAILQICFTLSILLIFTLKQVKPLNASNKLLISDKTDSSQRLKPPCHIFLSLFVRVSKCNTLSVFELLMESLFFYPNLCKSSHLVPFCLYGHSKNIWSFLLVGVLPHFATWFEAYWSL